MKKVNRPYLLCGDDEGDAGIAKAATVVSGGSTSPKPRMPLDDLRMVVSVTFCSLTHD